MCKESLRQQIENLKQESEVFLNDKNLPAEVRFFIKSMISMHEIIISVLLIKKPRKNSSNSGLPPSKNFGSNGNRNTTSTTPAKLGEQLPNSRIVNTTETTTPDICSKCGEDLSDTPVKDIEKRILIDIIYEVTKHEVSAEIKKCEHCGHINKGSFPKGMDGDTQYGVGIKTAIINYLMVQMMSLGRVQEHLMGLIGRAISEATMLKYVLQMHLSLATWECKSIEQLLKAPVIHCDETSIRINGKKQWLHVYSHGDISLQFIHSRRGSEAVDAINILPRYGGIIVHDCWATYFKYGNVRHALCGGHILRELRYIEECDGHGWAMMMKDLLKEASRKSRVLTSEEYIKLEERYREILEYALTELPTIPGRVKGKKGKVKQTDGQNLFLRLKIYEKSVLMFAKVKEVDFTNNRAERDIRGSKTKQKVSGCFRTLQMAQAYARITSYIKSMRYQGYSALQAIGLAMSGKFANNG